jgi:hypothetical protein
MQVNKSPTNARNDSNIANFKNTPEKTRLSRGGHPWRGKNMPVAQQKPAKYRSMLQIKILRNDLTSVHPDDPNACVQPQVSSLLAGN